MMRDPFVPILLIVVYVSALLLGLFTGRRVNTPIVIRRGEQVQIIGAHMSVSLKGTGVIDGLYAIGTHITITSDLPTALSNTESETMLLGRVNQALSDVGIASSVYAGADGRIEILTIDPNGPVYQFGADLKEQR